MADSVHPLIIIGSGPAGLSAGIYAARANLKPLIIEGKQPGGQLMGTTTIENWPGIISMSGPQLMMDMQKHALSLGCTFMSGEITEVDFNRKPFYLKTNKDIELFAQSIIIATGATPRTLQCPGEGKYWGKGVSTCAVCDGSFYTNKPIIIVGGGDTAMENASFMTNFTNKITIVHIGKVLTASAAMQERVLANPAITIIYTSTISEIMGDEQHITHVRLVNVETQESTLINTDALFIAIGLIPNTQPFKDQLVLEKGNYLKLTNQTNTSIPGIFGAGDVADYRYRQAITSAGAGCMAALDCERYLKKIN